VFSRTAAQTRFPPARRSADSLDFNEERIKNLCKRGKTASGYNLGPAENWFDGRETGNREGIEEIDRAGFST